MPKADSNAKTARPSKQARRAKMEDKRSFTSADELFSYITIEKGLHPALAKNCVQRWQTAQEKAAAAAAAAAAPAPLQEEEDLPVPGAPKLPRKNAARAKKSAPQSAEGSVARQSLPMDVKLGSFLPHEVDAEADDAWMHS